jgi:hypothetical protein
MVVRSASSRVSNHGSRPKRPVKIKRRRGINRGAFFFYYFLRCDRLAADQTCWIADNSQLAPRGRRKVHTSVASVG